MPAFLGDLAGAFLCQNSPSLARPRFLLTPTLAGVQSDARVKFNGLPMTLVPRHRQAIPASGGQADFLSVGQIAARRMRIFKPGYHCAPRMYGK